MSISNPKDRKGRRQSLRQGTGARRMREQGNCSGKGPQGKKVRQQSRCGFPGRKKSRGVNEEAQGWEIDEKAVASEKSQGGWISDLFESRIKLRSQRRRQWHQSRTK